MDEYQRNNALKNYEQALLDRRGYLMDSLAMAIRTGADVEAVQAKIRAFTQTNPEIAITAKSIERSLGACARYSSRAEGGVVLNARLAARVRQAVGD
ncbi:hypothetical protein IEQ11_08165 [Lysobacter capsici]|uniref:hypothetical protein n=1 Tax=Lysobacter capsici TaxID=435897 RepID=UPI0017841B1E|nr:hypothetical protein [Lysobacter capsici]UOF16606.1 hypothetical protein IEQ11_08165 [Lysobacter capsici]